MLIVGCRVVRRNRVWEGRVAETGERSEHKAVLEVEPADLDGRGNGRHLDWLKAWREVDRTVVKVGEFKIARSVTTYQGIARARRML